MYNKTYNISNRTVYVRIKTCCACTYLIKFNKKIASIVYNVAKETDLQLQSQS